MQKMFLEKMIQILNNINKQQQQKNGTTSIIRTFVISED